MSTKAQHAVPNGRRNSFVPLPPLKQRRVSVQFSTSSGRTSRNSRRGSIRAPVSQSLPSLSLTKQTEDEASEVGARQTMKFVYSEAVERAFRRRFMCTDFGPISAKPTQPSIEIIKLPQLYDEFQFVKGLVARKDEYIKKLKEELGDEPRPSKYGRNKYYKGRSRGNSIAQDRRKGSTNSQRLGSSRGSYQRLPSILSRGDTHSVSGSSLQTIPSEL